MTGSHLQQQYMVFCYLLLWASRIRGVIRRARQPHLRGEGWFFDVPVEADFYRGPGRLILRGYWLRMAIPCVLDIPAVVWVEIRRKQLADMGVKTQPMRLPDLMGQAGMARWPVCFEPQVPLLVLARGVH